MSCLKLWELHAAGKHQPVSLMIGLVHKGVVEGEGQVCCTLEENRLQIQPVFAPFEATQLFVKYLLSLMPCWVMVDALSSVTMDLARVAAALGFNVAVRLPEVSRIDETDQVGLRWIAGLLSSVTLLLPPDKASDEAWLRSCLPVGIPNTGQLDEMECESDPSLSVRPFGYEAYAFGRRDHGLLYAMQEPFFTHFAQCSHVLDVGCGTGVFLEVLSRKGIQAEGVERNSMSVHFARSLGHRVVCADALDYLESHKVQWDGVYCSHFIEHLPIDAAERLVGLIATALKPGGVAVFVFPDPESIRSQLLGFWRDPEHVRFYHSELVMALAQAYGLDVEFDSQSVAERRVVPFSMVPPVPLQSAHITNNWWGRILSSIGIASTTELQVAKARTEALEVSVRQLWDVNQTWAWDDNAVLRFRKR